MRAKPPDEVKKRLIALGAETLADCLVNLSQRNDDVDAATQRLIASEQERVKRFKSQIAGLRRGRKFIEWSRSREFAGRLEEVLAHIPDEIDPRMGVELATLFLECDSVLARCDDSSGIIGDVFRSAACRRWVSFAVRCDDDEWLVEQLERLLQKDEYGVRGDTLVACTQYLSLEQVRALAERFWERHEVATNLEHESWHWLGLVATIAKALVDPSLYEKAVLARTGGRVGGLYLDIARVYLEAGSPTGALRWLESSDASSDYKMHDRDDLLFAVFEKLGARKKQADVARRIFERELSIEALDRLVGVIGENRRPRLVNETARRIFAGSLSYGGARFLLEVGRTEEAEQHIVKHWSDLDGDAYPTLLDLAKRTEPANLLLATTCLYRALLESILERGQSRYYSHAVRYWKKLETLVPKIRSWGDIEPALSYRTRLRKVHGRKYAFWSKVDA